MSKFFTPSEPRSPTSPGSARSFKSRKARKARLQLRFEFSLQSRRRGKRPRVRFHTGTLSLGGALLAACAVVHTLLAPVAKEHEPRADRNPCHGSFLMAWVFKVFENNTLLRFTEHDVRI